MIRVDKYSSAFHREILCQKVRYPLSSKFSGLSVVQINIHLYTIVGEETFFPNYRQSLVHFKSTPQLYVSFTYDYPSNPLELNWSPDSFRILHLYFVISTHRIMYHRKKREDL